MKRGKSISWVNKKTIALLSVFVWLSILIKTDSYYSVYLLVGITSVVGLYAKKSSAQKRPLCALYILSVLLSTFVCLANYHIFGPDFLANIGSTIVRFTMSGTLTLLCLTCGFIVFANAVELAGQIIIKATHNKLPKNNIVVFLKFFVPIALLYSAVLLLCCYPGNLTSDSIDEVNQMMTNVYSNHHPFYFTILVKFFVWTGLHIFGDINIGICLFSIFQIVVLAGALSYGFTTLYIAGLPKKYLYPLAIFVAVMPYNIFYSFTMWKDVLFGAFFLIFIVATYRYFSRQSNHRTLSLGLIALSAIIICLFRSNGWLAFLLSTIIFFIIFRRKYIKFGFMLCSVVVVSFILKSPMLKILNVSQPDILESLSIPMQQMTRTFVEHKAEIEEQDIDLVENVVDVDKLIAAYYPIIHDPVKKLIRTEGNKQYVSEHKIDFAMLYIKLGIKHPDSYIKAWVEQTRGYFNSGYSYWKWADEIYENDLGIHKTVPSGFSKKIFYIYSSAFERVGFLNPFMGIGFMVWIILFVLYKSFLTKNKLLLFLTMLPVATWLTLLIATPVFSEFRYAYFLFLVIPFITPLALLNKIPRKELHEK